jgi:selenium-binding protein 1
MDRGSQYLAYDFWWHIGHDVMVTSEWGTPAMFEAGLNLDHIVNQRYGHSLRFWDLCRRRHVQTVDLGAEHQMVLELRPAHDLSELHGFAAVVASTKDLSSSIWTWCQDNGEWKAVKIIEIPAQAADPANLPPILQGFSAVPPLVTDIDLSLDDRFLYVSCWGTGELCQYDSTMRRRLSA